jgi:hypothetical protein
MKDFADKKYLKEQDLSIENFLDMALKAVPVIAVLMLINLLF